MDEIPFEDRYIPKAEIDWDRSTWWFHPLSRAIHPAMRTSALITSAVALLVIQFGLSLANYLFGPRFVASFDQWSLRSLARVPLAPIEIGQSQLFESLGLREVAYLTFCILWLSACLAFFGGILTRRAAVELGQRTIASWRETLRIVSSRMIAYVWVTGVHLVTLTCLLAIPFLLGITARLGFMAVVSGFLLILLVPLIIFIGRFVLSMFVCFPLSVAAISCEKDADAFEGFSRSNNYFFQRPVVATLGIVFLLGAGAVGYLLVYWIFLSGWHWMRDAFLSGAGLTVSDLLGPAVADRGTSEAVVRRADRLVPFIITGAWITRLVITAYWFSFFWSGTAALYLVLRRSVDNTNLDEIEDLLTGASVDLPEIPPPPSAPPTPAVGDKAPRSPDTP